MPTSQDAETAGDGATDAFTIAAQMLGDIDLTPGQLAQLRAADRRYNERLYDLLHGSDDVVATGGSVADTHRSLTPEEAAELHDMLVSAVLDVLTPAQRRTRDEQ